MKNVQEVRRSLRSFVQEFYNWYVPKARSDNPSPAWELALRQRDSFFSSELGRALREDLEAQANAKGQIVGLDFDPFLATQDPCERYEAGEIVLKAPSYWVDIYAVCSGKERKSPDVIAELVQHGDRWIFVNFRYPNDRDLLAVLKSLREARQKGVPRR